MIVSREGFIDEMKSIETWLAEYGESHQNPVNKMLHWLAVPLIYVTVIGLLWDIPRPELFASPWINWATIALLPAIIFYFSLSIVIGIAMSLYSLAVVLLVSWIDQHAGMSVALLSLIVFVLMWVLQFFGHYLEGKKPSFYKDIQFLLIGPMWLMAFVLKRLKINY